MVTLTPSPTTSTPRAETVARILGRCGMNTVAAAQWMTSKGGGH